MKSRIQTSHGTQIRCHANHRLHRNPLRAGDRHARRICRGRAACAPIQVQIIFAQQLYFSSQASSASGWPATSQRRSSTSAPPRIGFATGDLSARAGAAAGNRADELAELSQDFDHMAGADRITDFIAVVPPDRGHLPRIALALGPFDRRARSHPPARKSRNAPADSIALNSKQAG